MSILRKRSDGIHIPPLAVRPIRPQPVPNQGKVMRFSIWGFSAVLIAGLAVAVSGCNGSAASTSEETANSVPAAEKANGEKKEKAKQAPQRKTLDGRWVLVISQSSQSAERPSFLDFQTMLFGFTKHESPTEESGEYRVEVIDRSELFPYEVDLISHRVADGAVRLVIGIDENQSSFEGRLADGVVRGNIDFGGLVPQAARLEPTDEQTAKSFTEPKIPAGVEELQKAATGGEPFVHLRAFAKENSTSPFAPFVQQQLAGHLTEQEMSEQDVRQFMSDSMVVARPWGTRMEQGLKLNIALRLASAGHHADLALQYLDEAEKELSSERKAELEATLSAVRHAALTARARTLLAEGKEDEGLRLAHELREKQPLDPMVTLILGSHMKEKGKIDEAIPLYARLAALPLMQMAVLQAGESELPSQTLASLWTQKHGDTTDLETYIDEVYKEGIEQITEKAKGSVTAAPAAGDRVVLAELFTGASCPPCVAADLATAALEDVYEPSQAIVLRYHEPVPGPDPLTNSQSIQRFQYYGLSGTPSLMVSGTPVPPVGGFLEDVSRVYGAIREVADPLLAEQTPVRVSAKAEAKDGELTISAEATGIEAMNDLRLVVVLAENRVEMPAPNGIREHEMVVRSMFGHPRGVAPAQGRLSYETTVKLDQLKQQLIDDLTQLEQDLGASLPVKPLDMKELHLVAFVQNAQTKEVLQATLVPVEGEIKYTVDVAPPPPKETTSGAQKERPSDGPGFVLPDLPEKPKGE